MSIGQRISELRRSGSLSQEYVAERLGVTRQAVSKWETDASAPDTYNLIALAELFDVSVEYIATGKKATPEVVAAPTAEKNNETTSNKTLGIVLFGEGLLALILGFLVSAGLLAVSVYLLVSGIIFYTVKKYPLLTIMWTFSAITFLMISILTRHNLFSIFDPALYQDGITMGMGISYLFWAWLIATSILTVVAAVKRRRK